MMNLYREEEKEKRTLKERFRDKVDDIKLDFETSQFNRRRTLKRVEKAIALLDPAQSDAEQVLDQIHNAIVTLDLDDPRFGPTLNEASAKMLNEKREQFNQLHAPKAPAPVEEQGMGME